MNRSKIFVSKKNINATMWYNPFHVFKLKAWRGNTVDSLTLLPYHTIKKKRNKKKRNKNKREEEEEKLKILYIYIYIKTN